MEQVPSLMPRQRIQNRSNRLMITGVLGTVQISKTGRVPQHLQREKSCGARLKEAIITEKENFSGKGMIRGGGSLGQLSREWGDDPMAQLGIKEEGGRQERGKSKETSCHKR